MTDVTAFYAPKGGQGCTVTAAISALGAARNGNKTLLVDTDGSGDCFAVLGLSGQPNGPVSAGSNLSVSYDGDFVLDDYDNVIYDVGTSEEFPEGVLMDLRMVIRPCYLALRRAMSLKMEPSGVIIVEEPGRSLTVGDVEDVLGVDEATVVPFDPSIARVVDAGLLASRVPKAAQVLV